MGAGAERVKWGRDHAYTQILEVILELKLCREIRWTYGTYFITGDLRPTSSAQTPPMKFSPLQAVSSYFSSALRAEQVRH